MEASELVEAQIESIRTSPLTLHRIVVLGEQGGERLLPIWIGPFEAETPLRRARTSLIVKNCGGAAFDDAIALSIASWLEIPILPFDLARAALPKPPIIASASSAAAILP